MNLELRAEVGLGSHLGFIDIECMMEFETLRQGEKSKAVFIE